MVEYHGTIEDKTKMHYCTKLKIYLLMSVMVL